jgi:DHA2 family multidrug resistance protein
MGAQTHSASRQEPAAGSPPAAPAAPHPFNFRLAVGLVGILVASLSSGLNDRVTDVALTDWRGIGFQRWPRHQ